MWSLSWKSTVQICNYVLVFTINASVSTLQCFANLLLLLVLCGSSPTHDGFKPVLSSAAEPVDVEVIR